MEPEIEGAPLRDANRDRPVPGLSAVVLCGGRSRRFGRDKGLALLRGRPLVAYALEQLDQISTDVWISTNRPEAYEGLGRPMVADRHADCGPLGGLHAALHAIRHDRLVMVSCDMPHFSIRLLRFLCDCMHGCDVAVPVHRGAGVPRGTVALEGGRPSARRQEEARELIEPLHAVYARTCLPAVTAALERGERRVVSFFPEVRVCEVAEQRWPKGCGPSGRIFANINTPEDLEALRHGFPEAGEER